MEDDGRADGAARLDSEGQEHTVARDAPIPRGAVRRWGQPGPPLDGRHPYHVRGPAEREAAVSDADQRRRLARGVKWSLNRTGAIPTADKSQVARFGY